MNVLNRSRITLSALFFGAAVLSGCGLGNRLDAVEAVSLSTSFDGGECHFTTYQASVAPYIASQCVTCHATAGAGGKLVLTFSNSDDADTANFTSLLSYIDRSVPSADQTELLRRITSGTAASHPYKQADSAAVVTDLSAWVNQMITDPSCSSSGGGDNGGGGTGDDTDFPF